MSNPIYYDDAIRLVFQIYGDDASTVMGIIDEMNLSAQQIYDTFISSYELKNIGNASWQSIASKSGKTIANTIEVSGTITDTINSNVVTSAKTIVPVNTTVNQTGKVVATSGFKSGAKSVLGKVGTAITAASIGISLGKKFDKTLYQAGTAFGWDNIAGIPIENFNPPTWNDIATSDLDGLDKLVLGFLFADDGTTQTYIDEDTYAYIAAYLAATGALNSNVQIPTTELYPQGTVIRNINVLSVPDFLAYINSCPWNEPGHAGWLQEVASRTISAFQAAGVYSSDFYVELDTISSNNYNVYNVTHKNNLLNKTVGTVNHVSDQYNNYYTYSLYPSGYNYTQIKVYATRYSTPYEIKTGQWSSIFHSGKRYGRYALNLPCANISMSIPISGMSDQDGATLPDYSTWNDIPTTKQSLRQQYPELYENAQEYQLINPDGTTTTKTYIPVPTPTADNWNDNEPISGDKTQSDTKVDPNTDTQTLLDLITQLLDRLVNPTDEPDTGGGSSPVTPIPEGKASNLWRIYNPTQAQVDAFGGWLWSSNFVDQLKKLFNDPMQAIIGIHKVFVTPSIGGQTTIQCGYLDSEVPSNWVDEQYVTVDCGTISLSEKYLGIFDYHPFTRLSMYLPFIGIVDLDVSECMRGDINVKYHVDVLTGACLAEIRIKRDASTVCMYSYSGSAIVSYPLSSGSYLGALVGVASIATGAVASILTGGTAVPALAVAGTATGLTHLHADVAHSGNFGGCAGAMGIKKPYLIISRPQLALADNYEHYTGLPANSKVKLQNCTGYVKVRKIYPSTIHYATNDEKDMIEAELKKGVII